MFQATQVSGLLSDREGIVNALKFCKTAYVS